MTVADRRIPVSIEFDPRLLVEPVAAIRLAATGALRLLRQELEATQAALVEERAWRKYLQSTRQDSRAFDWDELDEEDREIYRDEVRREL